MVQPFVHKKMGYKIEILTYHLIYNQNANNKRKREKKLCV